MAITVALAGNPNSGKTTLFNELTGARQHVGNYPGVTVAKKEGYYSSNGRDMHIVDLPGIYSLTAYSVEEVVTRDFLANDRPDVVIDIVDASNLERNLYLLIQFREMGVPLCIAMNMIDAAKNRGIHVQAEKLSELLDVPVIPTIARSGFGKKELMESAWAVAQSQEGIAPLRISYGDDLDRALLEMEEIIAASGFLSHLYHARWIAMKYLEKDSQILALGKREAPVRAERLERIVEKVSTHLEKTVQTDPEAIISDYRYGYISAIIKKGVIQRRYDQNRLYVSDKIDNVLTQRFVGPVIMLLVLLGLYEFTFTYSEIPVGWFESFFRWLGDGISLLLPDSLLKSLIVSGVIDGVGGVLGFVPLILFMFFGIAILEDSGYLARVAFMLDRVFRIFGLHGSSVMAYIVSGGIAGGCAVPGVMATRTLRSRRERLATVLTVPFMNCGAKLPLFALLIAAFFSENEASIMLLLTIISWAGALVVAKVLRMTVIRGPATPFVMELPPYRFPTMKGLLIHTWERTWQYVKKAGTVILGISIILWAMMTFPRLPESKVEDFSRQRDALKAVYPSDIVGEMERTDRDIPLPDLTVRLNKQLAVIDTQEAEAALRNSVAGRIGTAIEYVSQWAGFDWRINIALIGGFAAKEVVVSTLGTVYSLEASESESRASLAAYLAASPKWSPLLALSLIIFTIFYAPCFVTIIVISKEAGSWSWGAFSMVFNTAVASLLAVGVFQVGSALGY